MKLAYMDKISLRAATREHLASAHSSSAGRSSVTVLGGSHQHLRQTLIALTAGQSLGEHDSPGEASLIVLTGHIRVSTDSTAVEGTSGDFIVIPDERHSLEALEDSAVVLTVAKP